MSQKKTVPSGWVGHFCLVLGDPRESGNSCQRGCQHSKSHPHLRGFKPWSCPARDLSCLKTCQTVSIRNYHIWGRSRNLCLQPVMVGKWHLIIKKKCKKNVGKNVKKNVKKINSGVPRWHRRTSSAPFIFIRPRDLQFGWPQVFARGYQTNTQSHCPIPARKTFEPERSTPPLTNPHQQNPLFGTQSWILGGYLLGFSSFEKF